MAAHAPPTSIATPMINSEWKGHGSTTAPPTAAAKKAAIRY